MSSDDQLAELRTIRELITEMRDMEREQLENYRQSADSALVMQRKALLGQRIALVVLGPLLVWLIGRLQGWF